MKLFKEEPNYAWWEWRRMMAEDNRSREVEYCIWKQDTMLWIERVIMQQEDRNSKLQQQQHEQELQS